MEVFTSRTLVLFSRCIVVTTLCGGSCTLLSVRSNDRRGHPLVFQAAMTSAFVPAPPSPVAHRCPFLDPVKSKHTYRVPRGGLPTVPSPPVVSANAPNAASIAALMYSSVASAKASKARAAEEAAAAMAAMHGCSDKGHGHRLHVVEMPPGVKARLRCCTKHVLYLFRRYLHLTPSRSMLYAKS